MLFWHRNIYLCTNKIRLEYNNQSLLPKLMLRIDRSQQHFEFKVLYAVLDVDVFFYRYKNLFLLYYFVASSTAEKDL